MLRDTVYMNIDDNIFGSLVMIFQINVYATDDFDIQCPKNPNNQGILIEIFLIISCCFWKQTSFYYPASYL